MVSEIAERIRTAVAALRESERSVELSHGKTRYFQKGTGRTLLLLHGVGFTAGGTNWLMNIDRLSRHRRVIAPDFLGFGTGARLVQPYSFAYLVDFVREFQDALGIVECDVLGHSMGGWVASLLAYESPQRIGKLVLASAGGVAVRPLPSMVSFVAPERASFDVTVAERLGLPIDAVADLASLEWEVTEIPGALEAYRRLLSHMSDAETRRRYETTRRLPFVKAETLVVWGDHDRVNDLSMGQMMVSLLPHGELRVLTGGHALPTEASEMFDAAVLEFLKAHDAVA